MENGQIALLADGGLPSPRAVRENVYMYSVCMFLFLKPELCVKVWKEMLEVGNIFQSFFLIFRRLKKYLHVLLTVGRLINFISGYAYTL